jgi:hypothetical protein
MRAVEADSWIGVSRCSYLFVLGHASQEDAIPAQLIV